MKLYEIDARIESILENNIDDETGVITDEVLKELEALVMTKREKLENCAKAYFSAKAREADCDTEIKRLQERKKQLKAKADRILDFMAFACNGEKTDCGIATLSFPKPLPSLKKVDVEAAINYLQETGRKDMLKITADISADAVKKLILSGVEVPGVEIEYKERRQLK